MPAQQTRPPRAPDDDLVTNPPVADPPELSLERKRRAENFPVALRVLPESVRDDLVAVYDVARHIDDLGDEAAGDRTALLGEFRADLATVWEGGAPRHPVLRALAPVVAAHGIERVWFERLVEANLVDQRVHHYASYADLLGYCALSAHPIGRIVLSVFDVRDAEAAELSDRVCAALQLIEHWQDVAEDRAAGRVYLPGEDLTRFDVPESDLDAAAASPALRRLMIFEVHRAARLLDSGTELVERLSGWARIAVAGYLAGGLAALDALRRTEGDVLGRGARTRRRDVALHLFRLLARAAGRGVDTERATEAPLASPGIETDGGAP
jgi:squalene synthase HpnC